MKGINKLLIGVVLVTFFVFSGCNPNSSSSSSSSSSGYSSSGSGSYNSYYASNSQSCNIGEPCCSDGSCDTGVCSSSNICIACGSFGTPPCDGGYCEYGSVPRNGICQVTSDYNVHDDCGFAGYPACYYDGQYVCYYGVLDSFNGVCRACGDYEQSCCQYTDYPCDYGECSVGYPYIGGICKKKSGTSSSSGYTTTSVPTSSNNDYVDRYTYDSGDSYDEPSDDSSCGSLGQECCVDFRRLSATDYWNADPPCGDGLECVNGYCEEAGDGPVMIAYTHDRDEYY